MSKRFKVCGLTKTHEQWDAEDPNKFLVQGHAEIVREGEPGGEAIAITVMSPTHLITELRSDAVELGRGCIFMLDYDERAVIHTLQTLIDGANAHDWEALQAALEKYFDWLD